VRPPTNYDALRQAEQQAQEARDTPSQPNEVQLDSAQPEPTRPTTRPRVSARYDDGGNPDAQAVAAEIARAAKEREDAAARAKEQDKGQGR
jgi:hypothetical protein